MPPALVLHPVILSRQLVLLVAEDGYLERQHGLLERIPESPRRLVALRHHYHSTRLLVERKVLCHGRRQQRRMLIVVQGVSGKDNLESSKPISWLTKS